MTKPRPAGEPAARPRAGADRVTVVLPWDLDPSLSAFPSKPSEGQLLVLETRAKPKALPFHRQKLTMLLSALRHFVVERRAAGFHVDHRVGDDYAGAVSDFAGWAKPAELHAVEPREWAVDARFRLLQTALPLTLHPDGGPGGHFLLRRAHFLEWAQEQRGPQLRMDLFYIQMRKRLGLLVDRRGKPEGGRWSFDTENRQHARDVIPPEIPFFAPDALTREVMGWVKRHGRWGALEPFGWPVTRGQAKEWLEDFVRGRLERFGPYEDAIRSDARFLFHSLLSAPLNLGLLRPEELAEAAVEAYRAKRISLASAEGFIRQVIGWREFIRGVYWHLMPGLREANQLDARLPLPDFFWEPEKATSQCLRDALTSVRDVGYTHHIERLMVLCNYATLARIDPRAVSHWFWAAFVDAYEWVELPNVVGMGMFGTPAFTTKPYVASAAYIKRMSGLPAKGRGSKERRAQAPCARCRYDPDLRTGPQACPYNALYWDFLAEHRERLGKNPRMRTLLGNLDRFGAQGLAEIRETARAHRATLQPLDAPWEIAEDAG